MGQGGGGFSLETMSGHENGPAGSSGLARACGLEQAHRRASYVTVKPAMTFQTLPTPFPSPGLYFYFLAGSENSLRSERGTEKVRERLRKWVRERERAAYVGFLTCFVCSATRFGRLSRSSFRSCLSFETSLSVHSLTFSPTSLSLSLSLIRTLTVTLAHKILWISLSLTLSLIPSIVMVSITYRFIVCLPPAGPQIRLLQVLGKVAGQRDAGFQAKSFKVEGPRARINVLPICPCY